jgi:hypothetical protein
MYVNWGNLHPFTFHRSKKNIRTDVLYTLSKIDFITLNEDLLDTPQSVTGAILVNMSNNATTALTITSKSFNISGQSIGAKRITGGGAGFGSTYYIELTTNTGVKYYTDVIRFDPDCVELLLQIKNKCTTTNYDWDTDSTPLDVVLNGAQQDAMSFETERETIITQVGEVEKTIRQKKIQNFKWVAPKGFYTILKAAEENDQIVFSNKPIKNFNVEKQDINDLYSTFQIAFEYDTLNFGDTCCDDIDLDFIADPGNTGGDSCGDFAVAITFDNGTLTANVTDAPIGTLTYRWFKNGVFQTTGTSVVNPGNGEWRVDARVDICRVSDSIFIADECSLFSLDLIRVANIINGDINGAPDCEESTSISVLFNGLEVGTSLPHTAIETGVYFVTVSKCGCTRTAGIFVKVSEIEECNFELNISENDGVLTGSATPPTGVTFVWEYQNAITRTQIAAGSTVNLDQSGIYWLVGSTGEQCIKELPYVYFKDECAPIRICNWDEMPGRYDLTEQFLGDDTSYEFTLNTIVLGNINNPETQLTVKRNGVVLIYESGTVNDAGQYGIIGNDIVLWSDMPLMAGEVLFIRFNS